MSDDTQRLFASLTVRLDELQAHLHGRFDELDARLVSIDARLAGIDGLARSTFTEVGMLRAGERITALEKRLDEYERRITARGEDTKGGE